MRYQIVTDDPPTNITPAEMQKAAQAGPLNGFETGYHTSDIDSMHITVALGRARIGGAL